MAPFEPVRPRRRLRIGLIGAGDISRYHLVAWQKDARAEVVAVCDRDEARARAAPPRSRFPPITRMPRRCLHAKSSTR